MRRLTGYIALLCLGIVCHPAYAQTMRLSTSNTDYQITNVVSDVDTFDFIIEIDAPLAPGLYDNPSIISVSYRVAGNLIDGTPSGFEAFALEREITGENFYAQGSSLRFEIDQAAVLEDGVQIAELTGSEVVFIFDGREIDNGRFHPALFELHADGTGRIQNSNNTPTLEPLLQVEFGEEYINDLIFDAGNTTLITATVETDSSETGSSGGGGVFGFSAWYFQLCLALSLWNVFYRYRFAGFASS